MLIAANIASHYMATNKRILITSKSSAALNVIRDKIAGKDGVFEDGSGVQKLIMSWGEKEAYKRFCTAADNLTSLAGERNRAGSSHDRLIAEMKRLSEKIEGVEKHFRDKSRIAGKSVLDIAETADLSEDLKFAIAINNMCNVNDELDEIRRKTPRELAEDIRQMEDSNPSFVTFLETDLRTALDKSCHQVERWFVERNLREQVEALRNLPSTSDAKGKGFLQSIKAWWTKGAAPTSLEDGKSRIMKDLADAGFRGWAEQFDKARDQRDIELAVPADYRERFVLLCCKLFLVRLKDYLPCASKDDPKIKELQKYETQRRTAMKVFVGEETKRHAIDRYNKNGFARKLTDFVKKYQEVTRSLYKNSKKLSKTGYQAQERLDTLLSDGELMDALPIWIMPTDLVSEILPANLDLFDLIILEEASQSDSTALPALLRGKKLVVIGDEKQLNPRASTQEYRQIILEKLGGELPKDTRDNLLPGRSVFDLFLTAFSGPETTVTLREHYRCLP